MALFQGTNNADTLSGYNSQTNIIQGFGGNDTLYGANYDDSIYGGNDNDKAYGRSGNDFIMGEAGIDTLYGEAGNDTLYGGTGADKLYGGVGNDVLLGENGNDDLRGDAGNDSYFHNIISGGYDKIFDSSGTNDQLILTNSSGSITVTRLGNTNILRIYDAADAADGVLAHLIEIYDFYSGNVAGAGAVETLVIGNQTLDLLALGGL